MATDSTPAERFEGIGRPETLGSAQLQAGESEQEWPEYGLEMVPVELHGEDTGRRLLLRNGEYIADVTDRYKILPNEKVLRTADEIAEQLGAVPWNEFDGDWYIQMDDHALMNEAGTRLHALYAWEDPVDIGDGDTIQFGFAVHNSIDKSLGFNVGLFTFRHACRNMVWMGVNGQGMEFDDREVVQHYGHKHTKGLEVENFKQMVVDVLTRAEDVSETYAAWREQLIDPEDVLDLLDVASGSGQLSMKDLPEWMQDADEVLARAEENDPLDNVPMGEDEFKRSLIENEMPEETTAWEVYNDVTEAVWHNDSTQDTSKRTKMKALHRVMEPADGVR